MARADVAAVCAAVREATGAPFVYRQWPKGSAPEWPCLEYHLEGSDNLGADNAVWRAVDRWSLSVYTEGAKDDALERAVEDELDARRIYWEKEEIPVRDEGLLQVEYSFSLPR